MNCPSDDGNSSEGQAETILVVEDEEEVRKVICLTLELQGYRVMSAEGPMEAIRLINDLDQSLDLLLTDVVMPFLSGPALYEAVRQQLPGTRVLYISGYSEEALEEHGLTTNDHCFLSKPFSSATLGRKVRQMLRS